jgi:glycosyltransferase involved in cell wall biosynthesis
MSVLNQDLQDIELILVDDHSTDGTWNRMEMLARKNEKVKAIKSHNMEGLTYSLNLGLDFARGEFVARLDVDDFAHSRRCSLQVTALEADPKASIVTSSYRLVDEGDWLMYEHCPPGDPKMLRWSLCFRNYIRHSTVMWRRSLNLRYDPSFRYAQDYDLWRRVALSGDIIVIPEVTATIRHRYNSITKTRYEEQEDAASRVTSDMYHHYTGSYLEHSRARRLRLMQHMKCSEQFKSFDLMSESDLRTGMQDYFDLASSFHEKEAPDRKLLLGEIKNDIGFVISSETHRTEALGMLRSIASCGNELAAETEETLAGIVAKN